MDPWLKVLLVTGAVFFVMWLLAKLVPKLQYFLYLFVIWASWRFGDQIAEGLELESAKWIKIIGTAAGGLMFLAAWAASSIEEDEKKTPSVAPEAPPEDPPEEPPPAPTAAPAETDSKGLPGQVRRTIFAVTDLDKAVEFYRDAFRWPIRRYTAEIVEMELPDGSGLALYKRENYARNIEAEVVSPEEGQVTGTELYLRVDDLQEATKRLEEAGGRLLSQAMLRDWGDVVAYFADPDGNVIAVNIASKT